MTAEHEAFADLFAKIEREQGFRGTLYRQKCLRRRVAVRMRARGVDSPRAYGELLDADPAEYERLLETLTINVSKFFRNPETWDSIRERVLPDLLDRDGRLVVWSAGTATGEEAYSLAILIREWANGMGRPGRRVRIIGTDIDARSLETARSAEYSDLALSETPPDVRARWFVEGPPHRLREPIRSSVEFRTLDILAGAPDFTADLILCRNLLIYLDREAQGRVFETFVETLRPNGYLVLGRVETLGPRVRDRFELIDTRERVYRKR